MVKSYLAKYQGTKPWTESEIYDAARACWHQSGGDVVMIRISGLSSEWEKQILQKIGRRIYGEA